jgi:hypothetical protein
MKFRLVVDDSNWLLLTGGRYSDVVVKTRLTVVGKIENPQNIIFLDKQALL